MGGVAAAIEQALVVALVPAWSMHDDAMMGDAMHLSALVPMVTDKM
jgi:hypothetical protein